jgi:phosphoribosylanthranilate isomerase
VTWVKICGITRLDDAEAAAAAGADAIGFVFFKPSARCIEAQRAAEIARAVGQRVTKVGVFVDASAHCIRAIAPVVGLDLVQLHGDQPAEMAASIGLPIIKHVGRDGGGIGADYPAAAFLADGHKPGVFGGTGIPATADAIAAAASKRRWILAGGLTPENVASRIARWRPWGVDVASGVERGPGEKDAERIAAFIANVRAVAADSTHAAFAP